LFGRKAEQFKDAKEEEQTRAEAKASARIFNFLNLNRPAAIQP
jgi:hypothetical protein